MSFKLLNNMNFILWGSLVMFLVPTIGVVFFNLTYFISWEVVAICGFPFNLDVVVDQKSMIMGLTVLFISANIFMFSKDYMAQDQHAGRFHLVLFIFVISMIILVFTPNLCSLLLGWDGLGISSFVLVMFYQNSKSLGAAMLTVLTNRLGDAFLIIAIVVCVLGDQLSVPVLHSIDCSLVLWLIVLASTTKSAQIPFVSWLPAAMAAPTPVSALVHSSTLVTAGVYLLIRVSPCFMVNPGISNYLLGVSALTILMASMGAVLENDLKKIIALSTLSQLGVMMMSLAFKIPNFTFFHLITHAVFKALMFLCAGSVIMLNGHSQDLRVSTNLSSEMPLISSAFVTSSLALMGFPFLAGFYSKDLIIELMLSNTINWVPLMILILGTILTSSYTGRLVINVFSGNSAPFSLNSVTMNSANLSFPCVALSLGGVIAGSVVNWVLMQPNIHPVLSWWEKMVPLILMLAGFFLILWLPKDPFAVAPLIHVPCVSMWFMVPLSTQVMIYRPMVTSGLVSISLEGGWMELLGPMAAKRGLGAVSLMIKQADGLMISKQVLFGFIILMVLNVVI